MNDSTIKNTLDTDYVSSLNFDLFNLLNFENTDHKYDGELFFQIENGKIKQDIWDYELNHFFQDIPYMENFIKKIICSNNLDELLEMKIGIIDCIHILGGNKQARFKKFVFNYLKSQIGKLNIKKNTNLIILGKIDYNITKLTHQLKEYNINFKRKFDDSIDYILLGKKPGDKIKIVCDNLDKIIFEDNLVEFLDRKGVFYLKNNSDIDFEYLKDMLFSNQALSLDLLNEFLENGGVPDQIKEELIIGYILTTDIKYKKKIKSILYLHSSNQLKKNIDAMGRITFSEEPSMTSFNVPSPYRSREKLVKLAEGTELNLKKLINYAMEIMLIKQRRRLEGDTLHLLYKEDFVEEYVLLKNDIKNICFDYKLTELTQNLFNFFDIESLTFQSFQTRKVYSDFSKLTKLQYIDIKNGNVNNAIKNLKPYIPETCVLIINGEEI